MMPKSSYSTGVLTKRIFHGAVSVIVLSVILFLGCGPSADTQYTRATALLEKPETLKEGISALTRFIDSHPEDTRIPDALIVLAAAQQTTGEVDASIGLYKRVISEYSGSSQAYKALFLLGYLYYDVAHDSQQAKRVLSDFIVQYPDSSLASSAQVILDNIDVPFDEWGVVKSIGTAPVD